MAYGKYKDLTKRTQSNKAFEINLWKFASNSKYNGYQKRLASMVLSFLIENLLPVI